MWGDVSTGNFVAHVVSIVVIGVLQVLALTQLIVDIRYTRELKRLHAVFRRDPQRQRVPVALPLTFIHRVFHFGQYLCALLLTIRAIDPVYSHGIINWTILDFCSYVISSTLLSLTAVFFYFTIRFWFGMRQRTIPHAGLMRGLFVVVSILQFSATVGSLLVRLWTRDPLYTNSIFTVWSMLSFIVLVSWVDFFAFRLWLSVRSLAASKEEVRRISQENDHRRSQELLLTSSSSASAPTSPVAGVHLALLASPSSSLTPADPLISGDDDVASRTESRANATGGIVLVASGTGTASTETEPSRSQRAPSASVGGRSGSTDDGTGTVDEHEPSTTRDSLSRNEAPVQGQGGAGSGTAGRSGGGGAATAPASRTRSLHKRSHNNTIRGRGTSGSMGAVNRSMRKLLYMLIGCNVLLLAASVGSFFILRNNARQSEQITYQTFVFRQWIFMWAHCACTYLSVWYAWQPHCWDILRGRTDYYLQRSITAAASTPHSRSDLTSRTSKGGNGEGNAVSLAAVAVAVSVDNLDGDAERQQQDQRQQFDDSQQYTEDEQQ